MTGSKEQSLSSQSGTSAGDAKVGGSDHNNAPGYLTPELVGLLRAAYVRAMEQRYGKNVGDWSIVGREEFGKYAPFEIPDGCRLMKEFEGPPKLLPPEAKYGKSLTLGILTECGGAYCLVFRGTVALYEWYYDLKFFEVHHPDFDEAVKVHGGFWEIYEYLRPAIFEAKKLMENDKKLLICGHSLGGALATFAALDLQSLNPEVITLATPKPGNLKFAREVNQAVSGYVRYTLKGDPVPYLPPQGGRFLKQDFVHPGVEIKLIPEPVKGLKERFIKAATAHLPSSYFEAAGRES